MTTDTTKKLDFAGLNWRLMESPDYYVSLWLPDGKREGSEWVALNPKRSDSRKGSFKISLSTGVWKDFATDDGGADLISLYAYLNGIGNGDAFKRLAELTGFSGPPASSTGAPSPQAEKDKPKPGRPRVRTLAPAPDNVPEVSPRDLFAHIEGAIFEQLWTYRTYDGAIYGHVARLKKADGGKDIRPIVWTEDDYGRKKWRLMGLPAPRPVYNEDKLRLDPDAPVVVCEGEKATDAAAILLPNYVAITSQGGAKAAAKTSWAHVMNRDVLIWPDNDDEGQNYADDVTKILKNQGCTVRRLKYPEGTPAKFDAADALAQGWAPEWLRAQINNGAMILDTADDSPATQNKRSILPINDQGCPYPDEQGAPWAAMAFAEFFVSRNGVVRQWDGGNHGPRQELIVLRPLWISAMTQTIGGVWGAQVRFFDLNWHERRYAFPMSRLNEVGGTLGMELSTQGLPVLPGKEKWVCRFLMYQTTQPLPRFRAASRLGWMDTTGNPVFVLTNSVMGQTDEAVVFQPETLTSLPDTLHSKGMLGEWKSEVLGRTTGNPLLMWAVLIGLSGPLLKPCQVQSGGFHIYGVTTGGKTTMAQITASIWGCGADPQEGPEITSIRKWNATANSLEATAEAHNDCALTLDEIGEITNPADLGRCIYQIAGGTSKSRATLHGGLRTQKTWRLIYLSTGEKSSKQVMAQVNQEKKGGQHVRLPDIPVDDDHGNRTIVRETGGQDPKEFVEDLKKACATYYGVMGPAFTAALIAEAGRRGWTALSGELRAELKYIEKVLHKDLKRKLAPEEGRVIERFALTLLAGMRATQYGLLPWALDQMTTAVREVIKLWLSENGESHSETDRSLAHLRDQLIANEHRFVWLKEVESSVIGGAPELGRHVAPGVTRDVFGFRSSTHYGITEMGMRKLCGEHEMRTILRKLRDAKLLDHDAGKLTKKWGKLPGYEHARPYLYTIRVEFLGGNVEEPPF